MMTPHTVEQLLQVFRRFRDNHASGTPLRPSYHKAVRSVAEAYSVTYQTIGDGCRRRLGLNNINELYELLAAWVKGDSRDLARQLKDNSEPSARGQIDEFFSRTEAALPDRQQLSIKAAMSSESETISFRLPARDARMLRALAALEGVSVAELTARAITDAVRDQMAIVARDILKE